MDKISIPAPYAFFKKLLDADDKIRQNIKSVDANVSTEQLAALYADHEAFTIAIDLWDGISKGIGSYDELLGVYRRFYRIMESNKVAAQPCDAGQAAYDEILQLLLDTGINFNNKD